VVPQDTPHDIPLTVTQMVMLGRYAHLDEWAQESAGDHEAVHNAMAQAGVEKLRDRPFHQLSGGERQRVVIARALAQQGDVLLMDEPSTHLDIAHQLELYQLARRLAVDGKSVFMICHDLFLAPRFADSALLLAAGAVAAQGSIASVLAPSNIMDVFGCSLPVPLDGCSTFCRKAGHGGAWDGYISFP
jgi:iron complex transport system ATP-binding protein